MFETTLSILADEFRGSFSAVPAEVAVVRLVLAAGLGAVIGAEREAHGNAAGLRTHMIISMASCLFSLVASEIALANARQSDQAVSDPLRLIEAVTAGVAFLAAGSIITSRGRVTGLTTGAGMWMAGAIGLACGSGLLPLAMVATVLAVAVLWLLRRLSRRLGPDDANPP